MAYEINKKDKKGILNEITRPMKKEVSMGGVQLETWINLNYSEYTIECLWMSKFN